MLHFILERALVSSAAIVAWSIRFSNSSAPQTSLAPSRSLLSILDSFFLLSLIGIWLILLYWVFLSLGSIRYMETSKVDKSRLDGFQIAAEELPFVSILIPAHNEALVIEDTVRAVSTQEYPPHRFEVIVINDGSSDGTGEIVRGLQREYQQLICYDVPKGQGGKGKSRTLNAGMKIAKGSAICVFDADNTPNHDCLLLLVKTLLEQPNLVAVNAMVRTRNANAGLLTRFINLEFIYFQWLFQGGRWAWFKLSMLMGTGYLIWREALDILGGFDEKSLVDDTEISLRIFRGKRRIRWIPYAVTWEQEPDSFRVWRKQRTRWAMGNLAVTRKYLLPGLLNPYPLGLEILTFVFNYFIFVPSLLMSDGVFFISLAGFGKISIPGPYLQLWVISLLVYVIQMSFFIYQEDNRISNYFLALLSYFTYAQLFIVILANAILAMGIQKWKGSELHWVKTVRTREKP